MGINRCEKMQVVVGLVHRIFVSKAAPTQLVPNVEPSDGNVGVMHSEGEGWVE
jgi:hypothetical protein